MKIAILTANLGDFDKPVDPVNQITREHTVHFHRFTDKDFPPIADLPPRFQYRIPKMFGWQMFPGYDIYVWLDGSMSFPRDDSLQWFLDKLGDNDMAVFKHPWRNTAKEETDHIEEKLREGNKYITARYKNGLHKEQLEEMSKALGYVDDELFASTVFVYRSIPKVELALIDWWLNAARFYTVDQIVMAYVLRKHQLNLKVIDDNLFKMPYLKLVSAHK